MMSASFSRNAGILAIALALLVSGGARAENVVVRHVTANAAGDIARCFKAPLGIRPPFPTVLLRLNFRTDGNLDGPPQLAGPPGGDAHYQAMVKAVLSAASRCVHLEAASAFTNVFRDWKTITVQFPPPGK